MSARRSFWADQVGSSAAELVLVMPIMVALMFGATELGYYLYCEHQVVKGVRDGARYGSRQSFVDVNCGANGTTPTLSSVIRDNIKEVTRTGKISGGTVRIPGWANADVTVTVTCPGTPITTGIYKGATNAPQINISASVTYPALLGDLGFIDFTGNLLNAKQQSGAMGI